MSRERCIVRVPALSQRTRRGRGTRFGSSATTTFNVWSERKKIEKLRYISPQSGGERMGKCLWGLGVEQFSSLRFRSRRSGGDRIPMGRPQKETTRHLPQTTNPSKIRKVAGGDFPRDGSRAWGTRASLVQSP